MGNKHTFAGVLFPLLAEHNLVTVAMIAEKRRRDTNISIRTMMHRARKKLEDEKIEVVTLRGKGWTISPANKSKLKTLLEQGIL